MNYLKIEKLIKKTLNLMMKKMSTNPVMISIKNYIKSLIKNSNLNGKGLKSKVKTIGYQIKY